MAVLKCIGVAEAAGCLLDPLNHRVDAFEAGVGQAMPKVREQVGQVALDQLGDRRHALEPAVDRPPVPAGEEGPRCPRWRYSQKVRKRSDAYPVNSEAPHG